MQYGSVTLFKENKINMEIYKGSYNIMNAPNGTGKTSLIKCMTKMHNNY